MRRIWMSTLMAGLLIVILVLTVYSQAGNEDTLPAVQILQGGVEQQVPIDVTLLVATDSGVQTVTVPLMLNLNLTIGPVDVIDMDVQVSQGSQFVSPITSMEPAASSEITSTSEISKTGGE